MTAQIRQSILKKEWNVSQKEIASAVRRSIKAKNQRRHTILQGDIEDQLMYKLKEGLASKMRKWKQSRLTSGGHNSHDDDDDELLEQQQVDYQDNASMSQQSGSLDGTRHKGAFIIAIEPEEEEEEEQVSSSTADMTSDEYQQQCWGEQSVQSSDSRNTSPSSTSHLQLTTTTTSISTQPLLPRSLTV